MNLEIKKGRGLFSGELYMCISVATGIIKSIYCWYYAYLTATGILQCANVGDRTICVGKLGLYLYQA